MSIKTIFDEISTEPGSNKKMEILASHKDNKLLERVLYLANSKRVKFYIKQIPEYTRSLETITLEEALDSLELLSERSVTGHEAILHLKALLTCCAPDDAYIIEKIIEKDCKIGMGTSNINKIFSSLIEKTPYMGAKAFDEKLVEKIISKGTAKSQLKLDGRYANAIIRDGEVELVSRSGEQNILTGARFMNELQTLTDEVVLNGELTIEGIQSRQIANGIINSLIDILSKVEERASIETDKKIKAFLEEHTSDFGVASITFQEVLDKIIYTCWDLISVSEYYTKSSSTPYHKRFDLLEKTINDKKTTRVNIVESIDINSIGEATKHFQEVLGRGLEGTILKESNGLWKDGKPVSQCKFKLSMNIDLKIIGFQYGEKGTKNEFVISTLLLESSCGLLKTNPSGMNEKMMADVTKRQDELLGTIVEMGCSGLSQNSLGNWSTMHPFVVELRNDKNTYDSLESAIAIENAKKGLNRLNF